LRSRGESDCRWNFNVHDDRPASGVVVEEVGIGEAKAKLVAAALTVSSKLTNSRFSSVLEGIGVPGS